jgi:hypothetical protein
MNRISSSAAKAMEFTSFRKLEKITDDELMSAVLEFEKAIEGQRGLIFHCLVRNMNNEYANVLFAESMQSIKQLEADLGHLPAVRKFFQLIDMSSVRIEFHDIQKDDFFLPNDFSCIEKGTFKLMPGADTAKLITISKAIENSYLQQFENTKGHFIGQLGDGLFSEITIGRTLAQTKQICNGYFNNSTCLELLDMADKESMDLGFWYVIA